jgi:diadenosine tetraphosphate (Ap4A) HIT family hydrolase
MKPCFFCDCQKYKDGKIFAESENFYARWDDMPVNNGHCEIIPKKHIESYFELTKDQAAEMHGLAQQVNVILDERFQPDAYTIGVNDGRAAGRRQDHLHVHVIPRYDGDVSNAENGIRNMFPGREDYTEIAEMLGRGDYVKRGT